MKNDKIFKYSEFLKENIQETPETYVDSVLKKLENRIRKMFGQGNGDVKSFKEVDDESKKEKGKMSFADLNLELQSLELSKYSKMYDNVKLKFSDEKFLYDITFTIDLKDAVPGEDDKDFSDKDIEKCQVKFKKYDQNDGFNLLGQLSKTAKIDDIDEEYLINLKIELDDENGGDDEEFEIETE
jgi:hypothetical protein